MRLRITKVGFIFLLSIMPCILTCCVDSNEEINSPNRLAYTVAGEIFVLSEEPLDYLGLGYDSLHKEFISVC